MKMPQRAMQQKHDVFVWYVRENEDSYLTNNSCLGTINVVRQTCFIRHFQYALSNGYATLR